MNFVPQPWLRRAPPPETNARPKARPLPHHRNVLQTPPKKEAPAVLLYAATAARPIVFEIELLDRTDKGRSGKGSQDEAGEGKREDIG